MAQGKKSFLLYCDLIGTFEELTDDEAGRLIKHVLRYVNDMNPDAPDRLTKITFEPIKQALKRDLVKYEQIREKKRFAGLASAESRKQNQQVLTGVDTTQHKATHSTVNDIVIDSVIVSDNVIDNVKETQRINKFIPPTLSDVINYCTERSNNVDANKFIDFYESKGWMVGKNKMKDWKAAIRTWENSSKQTTTTPQAATVTYKRNRHLS